MRFGTTLLVASFLWESIAFALPLEAGRERPADGFEEAALDAAAESAAMAFHNDRAKDSSDKHQMLQSGSSSQPLDHLTLGTPSVDWGPGDFGFSSEEAQTSHVADSFQGLTDPQNNNDSQAGSSKTGLEAAGEKRGRMSVDGAEDDCKNDVGSEGAAVTGHKRARRTASPTRRITFDALEGFTNGWVNPTEAGSSRDVVVSSIPEPPVPSEAPKRRSKRARRPVTKEDFVDSGTIGDGADHEDAGAAGPSKARKKYRESLLLELQLRMGANSFFNEVYQDLLAQENGPQVRSGSSEYNTNLQALSQRVWHGEKPSRIPYLTDKSPKNIFIWWLCECEDKNPLTHYKSLFSSFRSFLSSSIRKTQSKRFDDALLFHHYESFLFNRADTRLNEYNDTFIFGSLYLVREKSTEELAHLKDALKEIVRLSSNTKRFFRGETFCLTMNFPFYIHRIFPELLDIFFSLYPFKTAVLTIDITVPITERHPPEIFAQNLKLFFERLPHTVDVKLKGYLCPSLWPVVASSLNDYFSLNKIKGLDVRELKLWQRENEKFLTRQEIESEIPGLTNINGKEAPPPPK